MSKFFKGWAITVIAEALLILEDAIRKHLAEYRESKKLKPENGGSVEKLSVQQSKLLKITEKYPPFDHEEVPIWRFSF